MGRAPEVGVDRNGDPSAARPVREGLFRTDPPALIGGRCATCGFCHFPVGPACPYCSASEVTETLLPDVGRLWAWTTVTSLPPGAFGEVPYGFGVVELDDGTRVVTRLAEHDPSRLHSGQQMRLVLVELAHPVTDDGVPVITYAFAPEGPRARTGS